MQHLSIHHVERWSRLLRGGPQPEHLHTISQGRERVAELVRQPIQSETEWLAKFGGDGP